VYDLATEAEFLAQGLPEDLKRQFVEETEKKLRDVDQDDREDAREKRRLKRAKRDTQAE